MSGEAGRAMLRLKVIYDTHDVAFREQESALAMTGDPVRCTRGCNDCCYLLATCTLVEALAIVQRMRLDGTIKDLIRRRPWEALEEELHADEMNSLTWMALRHPCVLLDTNTRDCTVYELRPSACRAYAVVTDPALCAVPGAKIGQVDRRQEMHATLQVAVKAAEELGVPNVMLPLPIALKWACIVYLDGIAALRTALSQTAFASDVSATFYWASLEFEDGRTFEHHEDGVLCRVCGNVTPDTGGPPRCDTCGTPHRTGKGAAKRCAFGCEVGELQQAAAAKKDKGERDE